MLAAGVSLTIGKGPVDVRERVSRFGSARRRGNRPQIDKGPAGPGPGLVGRRFLENPVGNTREGRVGSTGDGRFSGATYPPTETCGRSPLAAPVVFLTGRSRERTRPRGRGRPGRRLGAADVLEAGTAGGLADRTAGGRNRSCGSAEVAPWIFDRSIRPAARTDKPAFSCTKSNRGGEIRTLDLLVPNQAR
jgi:hypothetical protein